MTETRRRRRLPRSPRRKHGEPAGFPARHDGNTASPPASPIVTSDGHSGSGALVGGRIVLTARHVPPERSIKVGNWWMKFTPHYFDAAESFGSSFISDSKPKPIRCLASGG